MSDNQVSLQGAAIDEILRRNYERLDQPGKRVNAGEIAEAVGLTPIQVIRDVFEEMKEEGLIDLEDLRIPSSAESFSIPLSSRGILLAEERGLADATKLTAMRGAREALLRHMAAIKRELGSRARTNLQTVVDSGHEKWAVDRNLQVLSDEGLVEQHPDTKAFMISPRGLEQVERRERQENISARLVDIEILSPQPRGKKVETLIVDALKHQDCHCDEDMRNVGEQIDLTIQQASHFFLAESKWEKDPVEGGVVSEMVGRLMSRPANVMGVIFSMSGFTSGAYSKTTALANQRVVLLVPEADVRGILRGERLFADIVSEQLRQIVARGKLQPENVKPRPRAKGSRVQTKKV